MEADVRPFLDDKSVESFGANLEGAKYTLATNAKGAELGIKDFTDIATHKDALDGKIYGIEPGNDGNRLILDMIDKDTFGLKGFEVVESSEQGMLAQVARAEKDGKPIVFLGWEPHPMNANFKLTYLSGGDDVFGPNFGGATVYTNVRAGYTDRMPECRQAAHEPEVLAADGKRDHGQDPQRRQGSGSSRNRMAEGQSDAPSSPGLPASPPRTVAMVWQPSRPLSASDRQTKRQRQQSLPFFSASAHRSVDLENQATYPWNG